VIIIGSYITGVKQIEDLFKVILWKEIQKCKRSFHFNYFYSKLPTSVLGFSLRETLWSTDIFSLSILFSCTLCTFGKASRLLEFDSL